MSYTRVLTAPEASYSVGPGAWTADLPADGVAIVLQLNQVDWPHVGDDAVSAALQCSYDGGSTYLPLTGETLLDVATPGNKIMPANSFRIAASVDPEVGGITRKGRVTFDVVKPLTFSAFIDSVD